MRAGSVTYEMGLPDESGSRQIAPSGKRPFRGWLRGSGFLFHGEPPLNLVYPGVVMTSTSLGISDNPVLTDREIVTEPVDSIELLEN